MVYLLSSHLAALGIFKKYSWLIWGQLAWLLFLELWEPLNYLPINPLRKKLTIGYMFSWEETQRNAQQKHAHN